MNAINVIAPYKHLGMWVFDDPRVGLNQEPFVAGADAMIDRVVADIPNAEHGFTLIFAAAPAFLTIRGASGQRISESCCAAMTFEGFDESPDADRV
jgi:hypothetical protein